ncbi:haloacid dehalogenase domain-containing protein hydrolase [Thermincola ferriacetica]|uniref:Haloacid dehalogenase domain-containing protein hydrolase n=1 Tax=Thermincola ferriacetica TaxID=281456 RepID=A0A0L6W6G3_9FIRM|nr:HAD hydrolase-like protein [Thermincola ferriacetica]KNZ71051.1 haloacid dehalogenase domain-containing protein hydrolase [Thermincola ferriacetica]
MQGIIFDFDDTLVETTIYFDQAKEKFAAKMKELGFPIPEALDTLNKFDIRNVLNCGGFLKECFPKALVETYEYYCSLHNLKACRTTAAWLEQLGWKVFDAPVVLIDGAEKVVKELARDYRLFLATKGEPETQVKRLKATGLAQYFEKVYVVPDKTPVEYKRIAAENRLEPAQSWVVGNSMKGDINPGLKVGFNCIHVYHRHTWDFEEEPPVGDFVSVQSLEEIPDIIKNGEK